jgi:hypothetical protein
METQESPKEQGETAGDESPEEFAQDVENDPSTATSGDDELEQVRGG